MNSEKVVLSNDDLTEIETLSSLFYSVTEIALYLGIDYHYLNGLITTETTPESIAYRRGVLISEININKKLLGDAEAGSVKAIQEINKIKRNKGFQSSKLDIFGGFENKETLDKIKHYVLKGDYTALKPNEGFYIDVLILISSLDRRVGKRSVLKFLTDHLKLTYAKAIDLYNESINLFYCDKGIAKDALRNKYAEELDQAAAAALAVAQNSRDYECYAKIKEVAAKIRQFDKEDPEPLDNNYYRKPVKLFSTDTKVLGLSANRTEVAEIIDGLDLPETDKNRLRQDAQLTSINIDNLLNESQEASQSNNE